MTENMHTTGNKKRVGVYRMIRTNKFLEFTAEDLAERNRKAQETYDALQPEKKVISKEAANNFFQRLMEDGIRRYVFLKKLHCCICTITCRSFRLTS